MPQNRRSFLLRAAGILGSGGLIGTVTGAAGLRAQDPVRVEKATPKPVSPAGSEQPRATAKPTPLFRLSLAELSLHRSLFGRAAPQLTNLEFPHVSREVCCEGA